MRAIGALAIIHLHPSPARFFGLEQATVHRLFGCLLHGASRRKEPKCSLREENVSQVML